jgi:2-keto-4-pentenoate hydratase
VSAGTGIDAVAAEIFRAQRDRTPPIRQPGEIDPGLDLESGYAVQRAVVDAWLGEGAETVGWKIGMSSAIGRLHDSPGPIYGRLLSNMLVAEGEPVEAEGLHDPHIEAEIAFVMDAALEGPGVTVARVEDATRALIPALEIYSRRFRVVGVDRTPRPCDWVADNAGNTFVRFGAEDGRSGARTDTRLAGMVLERDGAIIATGAGARILGNPAAAVAWLANELAKSGQAIEAGETVITGSLADPEPIAAGDRYRAEIGGLGEVSTWIA